MYLGYIIILGTLFISCLLCVIIFRNYHSKHNFKLSKSELPLMFLSGVSMSILDILESKRSHSFNRLLYCHRLKVISYIIAAFLLCTAVGFAYLVSIEFSQQKGISSLMRPDTGSGERTTTIIADSDMYQGPIDITLDERQYTFEEAMQLFNGYRPSLDETVLGDNASFLMVSSPLYFPSTIGMEQISISWSIEDTNVIDYSGDIVATDIPNQGIETNIIATLTISNISVDICYHIRVLPIEKDSKTLLSDYINNYINSDININKSSITLPKEFNGGTISFFESDSPLPP